MTFKEMGKHMFESAKHCIKSYKFFKIDYFRKNLVLSRLFKFLVWKLHLTSDEYRIVDASSVTVSQSRAMDKSEPPKSADDGKSSPTSCRSRSPTETGSIDDKQ